MDDPDLGRDLHAKALEGLSRINRVSRTGPALWTEIERSIPGTGGPVRVLDVGCGGGDLAVWLYRRATRSGRQFRVDGCDASPFAVEYASRNAATGDASSGVRFFQHDVLSSPLPGRYDVAICSLFLHHFDEDDAVAVMTRMRESARRAVLIVDLRRTRTGYWLAWAGCRLLSRSPVVHLDGPLSVEGAFTSDEVRSLATRAGLAGVRVRHCWPQRFVLAAAVETS